MPVMPSQVVDERDELGPGLRCPLRHGQGAASDASGTAIWSRIPEAAAGPTPGSSFSTRKPATRSRGFWAKRRIEIRSLTCAASRNFRPPNLTKGMFRRVSSISSWPLWWAVRNSAACDFSEIPASRASSTFAQT
jgi:hypothetical protein